jgi:hypothetical protein
MAVNPLSPARGRKIRRRVGAQMCNVNAETQRNSIRENLGYLLTVGDGVEPAALGRSQRLKAENGARIRDPLSKVCDGRSDCLDLRRSGAWRYPPGLACTEHIDPSFKKWGTRKKPIQIAFEFRINSRVSEDHLSWEHVIHRDDRQALSMCLDVSPLRRGHVGNPTGR